MIRMVVVLIVLGFLVSTVPAVCPAAAMNSESDMDAAIELGSASWIRFELETPGGWLPFIIEFQLNDELKATTARIVNGTERIEISPPRVTEDGRAFIPLPYFNSELRGFVDKDGNTAFTEGVWVKERGDGLVMVPYRARKGNSAHDRFDMPMTTQVPEDITGRWTVQFSSAKDEPAVGEFTVASDGTATGTFLTVTGDYRYLEGRMNGNHLMLSAFDGAHAFLFKAELMQNGVLEGDFWSGDWWHETWEARRKRAAALPNGFSEVKVVGDGNASDLTYLNLEGETTRIGDHLGTVTIVELFGSWCPNCADASRLLHEYAERYSDQGLKVIGLAFEVETDPAKAAQRVEYHMRHHVGVAEVPWPVLIAGTPDKEGAARAVPVIDRVTSYPTFLFLDERGVVQSVFSGFQGPATGADHERMRKRLEGVIEGMLGKGGKATKRQSDGATK